MEGSEKLKAIIQGTRIPYDCLTMNQKEELEAYLLPKWRNVCEHMDMNFSQIERLEKTTYDRDGRPYPNNASKVFDHFVTHISENSLNNFYEILEKAGLNSASNYVYKIILEKCNEYEDEWKHMKRQEDLCSLNSRNIKYSNGYADQQLALLRNSRGHYQNGNQSFESNNMECESTSQINVINKCRNSVGRNSLTMHNDSSQTYTEETCMDYDDSHSRHTVNLNNVDRRAPTRINGSDKNNFSNIMDYQPTNESTESESCNSSTSPNLPEDLGKIYARPGYNTGTFPNASKKSKKTNLPKPIGLSTNSESLPCDYCLSQPTSFRDFSKFRSRVLIVYDSSDKKNMDKITNIACWLIKNKFRVEYDHFKAGLVRENRESWMKKVYKEAPFVLLCITPSFEKNILKGRDNSLREIWTDIEKRLTKDPSNTEGNSIVPLLISPAKQIPSILRTIVHYKWKDDWQSLSFFLSAPYKLPVNKDSKAYSDV